MKRAGGGVCLLMLAVAGLLLAAPAGAESLDRELLGVVRNGKVDDVRRLLDEGAKVRFCRINGTVELPETTALREAVTAGQVEIMRLLLERAADDRVLADAAGFLPLDDNMKHTGIESMFVETLLKQGKFEVLAKVARSIHGEAPLKRILESGDMNDPEVLVGALNKYSWDMVALAASRLKEFEVPPCTDNSYGQSLPLNLVSRVRSRSHEENKAVDLWLDFEARGLGRAKWREHATKAAKYALDSGLVHLAEAMDPALGKAEHGSGPGTSGWVRQVRTTMGRGNLSDRAAGDFGPAAEIRILEQIRVKGSEILCGDLEQPCGAGKRWSV